MEIIVLILVAAAAVAAAVPRVRQFVLDAYREASGTNDLAPVQEKIEKTLLATVHKIGRTKGNRVVAPGGVRVIVPPALYRGLHAARRHVRSELATALEKAKVPVVPQFTLNVYEDPNSNAVRIDVWLEEETPLGRPAAGADPSLVAVHEEGVGPGGAPVTPASRWEAARQRNLEAPTEEMAPPQTVAIKEPPTEEDTPPFGEPPTEVDLGGDRVGEPVVTVLTETGPVSAAGYELVVGRKGDLALPDRRVSLRHAVIRIDRDGATIEHLRSSNGLVVDGESVVPGQVVPLESGSVVVFFPSSDGYPITIDWPTS